MDQSFYVYILTNRPNGVLYVGATRDLVTRVWQHRTGCVSSFTSRFNISRLVYFEVHTSVSVANDREYLLKRWRRAWKVRLIEEANPEWRDLFDDIAQ